MSRQDKYKQLVYQYENIRVLHWEAAEKERQDVGQHVVMQNRGAERSRYQANMNNDDTTE